MTLGPVQVLLVGTSAEPDGRVLAELDRLADAGIVHLIDLVVVHRVAEDALDTLPAPAGLHVGLGLIAEEFLAGPTGFSPDPAVPDGEGSSPGTALAPGVDDTGGAHAAPSGAGPAGEMGATPPASEGAATWSLLDAVPVGGTAVIALIEHLWAVPLRAALQSAGAAPLGESWLGPADLADLDAIVQRHRASAP